MEIFSGVLMSGVNTCDEIDLGLSWSVIKYLYGGNQVIDKFYDK